MTEILGTKYAIAENDFTIQYLYQTGPASMPRSHSHPTYEIYYLLDGERVFFVNETVYTAQKGELILLHPHDIHRTTSSDALKCERILINFSESFLATELSRCQVPLLQKHAASPLIHFPIDMQTVVEELLQKMLRECELGYEAVETCVRAQLIELLVHMRRHTIKESMKQTVTTHPMHQKMTEVAGYLNDNFHSQITLHEVSKLFYISPSYLSRTFKRITGFQFKEYLQIIRLREAKRLLRESNAPISQIAENTGFEHVANFNVMFKKVTGVTPSFYRKSNRCQEITTKSSAGN